jgi:hypothetical protein
MRSLATVIVLVLSASAASSQATPPPPNDSTVVSDSSRGKPLPIPLAIPQNMKESHARICARLSQTKCAFLGALFVGGMGYLIGDASSPKPEYVDNGLMLGGRVCRAHCGFPKRALVLGITGSAIGGIAGWIMGKETPDY